MKIGFLIKIGFLTWFGPVLRPDSYSACKTMQIHSLKSRFGQNLKNRKFSNYKKLNFEHLVHIILKTAGTVTWRAKNWYVNLPAWSWEVGSKFPKGRGGDVFPAELSIFQYPDFFGYGYGHGHGYGYGYGYGYGHGYS